MYKRGSTWWTCLRVNGQKSDQSLGTSNKKLAQTIEARLKIDIAEGRYLNVLPGQKKGLSDLKDEVLAKHCGKLCKKTASTYDKAFRLFIDFVGDLPLLEISARHISRYKQSRLEKGIKPATVNREMACLSKSFNLARNEWEWIHENPFTRVSREREDNIRYRWLLEDEETALLSVCPDWLRDLVVFAIYTGMRQGELIGLEWKDVDLKRKCVTLLKTKTKYPRTVHLSSKAYDVLVRRQGLRNLKVSNVFLNANGWKVEQAKLGKEFRKVLKKAELENFRFHDLRHTFGTRLAQNGADIFHIAKLMGHRHISTTMRYLHHTNNSLAKVVGMLD